MKKQINLIWKLFLMILIIMISLISVSQAAYAGDITAESGKAEIANNNEVFLSLKNTESNGRDWRLVSAGSAGGIGVGKFAIYDTAAGISRLTINTNGNIGIGTTSPLNRLNVHDDQISVSRNIASSNAYNWLAIRSNRAVNDYGGLNAEYAKLYLQTAVGEHRVGDLRVAMKSSEGSTAMTDVLTIKSNGNVGIGTTGPGTLLELSQASANAATVVQRIRVTGISARPVLEIIGTDASPTTRVLQIAGFKESSSNQMEIFTGSLTPGTLGTSRLVIDNSGNVGIGTTSPTQKLDVNGNVKGTQLCIGTDCRSSWPSGGGSSQWTTSGSNIYYNAGNVGIGTTSPGERLHVSGNARIDGFIGTTNTDMRLVPGGNERMRITTGGNVGIGTTSPSYKLHVAGNVGATAFFYTSDARLKYDIQPAKGLDIIGKLNGVSFAWKDTDKRSAGLIAQDVEKVLPEAVSTDSSTGIKSLNYGALTAPIVESIKELDKNSKEKDEKISELQNEIEILKEEIEKLKK